MVSSSTWRLDSLATRSIRASSPMSLPWASSQSSVTLGARGTDASRLVGSWRSSSPPSRTRSSAWSGTDSSPRSEPPKTCVNGASTYAPSSRPQARADPGSSHREITGRSEARRRSPGRTHRRRSIGERKPLSGTGRVQVAARTGVAPPQMYLRYFAACS